jgi:hypothetical protein
MSRDITITKTAATLSQKDIGAGSIPEKRIGEDHCAVTLFRVNIPARDE